MSPKGTRSYLRERKPMPMLQNPKKRACARKRVVAEKRPVLLTVLMAGALIRVASGASFGLRCSKRLIQVSSKPQELQGPRVASGATAGAQREYSLRLGVR